MVARIFRVLTTLLGLFSLGSVFGSPAVAADAIAIVDVHNQYDGTFSFSELMHILDRNGIGRIILAPHLHADDEALLTFAAKHPDRITPAVRTKTREFFRDRSTRNIARAAHDKRYGGMQEILVWHAQKGNFARKRVIDLDDPRISAAADIARGRGWPLMLHIEFVAAGHARGRFMAELEKFLVARGSQPIGLMHRGQLGAADLAPLLKAHPNLFVVLSHSTAGDNKGILGETGFSSIFDGPLLQAEWRKLVIAQPRHFVMSFDNPFGRGWKSSLPAEVKQWRSGLATLPPEVAQAIAHVNAERIWKLPPTKAVASTN